MANALLDLQDAMDNGMSAMRGLRDLLHEAVSPGKNGFFVANPDGLAALIDLVVERMSRTEALLQGYVEQTRSLHG